MSELKHWLDETSEADEFERAILRAGLDADPPEAKQDQIWAGLMSAIAIAPVAAATTAATTSAQAASANALAVGVSKGSAVWLAVAKGFVVGLAVYGAAAGVGEISNRLDPPRTPSPPAQRALTLARGMSAGIEASTAAVAPVVDPQTNESLSAPRPAERVGPSPSNGSKSASPTRETANQAAPLPSVATFDDSARPSSTRVSQLEAETRALRQARDELRAGKLADAFATLEASRRQFTAPALHEEREALIIELLSRSGQVTAAAERARAFLDRFPESPHAQQIRRFAGQ